MNDGRRGGGGGGTFGSRLSPFLFNDFFIHPSIYLSILHSFSFILFFRECMLVWEHQERRRNDLLHKENAAMTEEYQKLEHDVARMPLLQRRVDDSTAQIASLLAQVCVCVCSCMYVYVWVGTWVPAYIYIYIYE